MMTFYKVLLIVIIFYKVLLIMMTFYKVLHLFICQVGFLAENRMLQKSIIFHQSRHQHTGVI